MKSKDWDSKLTNADRYGVEAQHPNSHRTEFEEDYDNIIFSSAFRRLQGKTQVYGLSGSDYVRTRLTHSCEVATNGRSLGTMVENRCVKKLPSHPSNLGTIVAAACLAHDIGNPPFGHSGEFAIRQWFKNSKAVDGLKKEDLNDDQRREIENYEGNAQGFRLVTKLQGNREGLKLTYATLAAMTKYPFGCGSHSKKYGFFRSEKGDFEKVAKSTGLIRDPEHADTWFRHPLAHLVEASDDLCNRIIDLEDSARLGILNSKRVLEHFQLVRKDLLSAGEKRRLDDKTKVELLSRRLLCKLTVDVAKAFIDHEAEILSGKFSKPLIEVLDEPAKSGLDKIYQTLKADVFTSRQVIEIEAPAFRVLNTLLETFVVANEEVCKEGEERASKQSRVIMGLVPKEFKSHTKSSEPTACERLFDILDFVSGMTDAYAVSLFKTITGISLPTA